MERAIVTFKEHFVAALTTVDMLCPLQLWDKFLPQVELTLNLLRFSCRNPGVSTRYCTDCTITTKRPLPLLGQKHWFMTILQQEPPGRRMQLTFSTLARPTTTAVVFVSTYRQLGASALRTRGSCTLPIAKSLLHLNKTKLYLQLLTSSNDLDDRS